MQPKKFATPRSIVVLGESGVGKTCFGDMFLFEKHFALHDWNLPPFSGEESPRQLLEADGEKSVLSIEDISLTPIRQKEPGFRADLFEQILRDADGVVLLYDITIKQSYDLITEQGYKYAWECRKSKSGMNGKGDAFPSGRQRFGCVLVGNKLELAKEGKREVGEELAEEWASMHGIRSYELDTHDRDAIVIALSGLVKSCKRAERRDRDDVDTRTRKEAERGMAESDSSKGKQAVGDASLESSKKTGLSRSLTKLRDALPSIRSKPKAPK